MTTTRLTHRLLTTPINLSTHYLPLLLAFTAVRGAFYALLNPPFMSPDEGSHFRYVAYLATAGASGDAGPEANQPVLYYALMVPAYWISEGHSPAVQLLAIRLFSMLFLLGCVWMAWRTAKLLYPAGPMPAIAVASMVALAPQFTSIGVSVNNDAVANFAGALLVLLSCRLTLQPRRDAALAIVAVAALALFTKGSVFPLVIVGLSAVAVYMLSRTLSVWAKASALIGLAASAALFAWQTRPGTDSLDAPRALVLNIGTTWPELASRVVQFGKAPFVYEYKTFWASFVGVSVQPPGAWYIVMGVVIALAALGHLLWLSRAGISGRLRFDRQGALWVLILGAFALQFLASVVYYAGFLGAMAQDWDPVFLRPEVFLQGRYLFPAMVPFAIITVEGLRRLSERQAERWLAPALVCVMMLFDLSCLLALGARYGFPVQDGW